MRWYWLTCLLVGSECLLFPYSYINYMIRCLVAFFYLNVKDVWIYFNQFLLVKELAFTLAYWLNEWMTVLIYGRPVTLPLSVWMSLGFINRNTRFFSKQNVCHPYILTPGMGNTDKCRFGCVYVMIIGWYGLSVRGTNGGGHNTMSERVVEINYKFLLFFLLFRTIIFSNTTRNLLLLSMCVRFMFAFRISSQETKCIVLMIRCNSEYRTERRITWRLIVVVVIVVVFSSSIQLLINTQSAACHISASRHQIIKNILIFVQW